MAGNRSPYGDGKRIVCVTGEFIRESEKAIGIRQEGYAVEWYPKSQFDKDPDMFQCPDTGRDMITVFVPLWLPEAKEDKYQDLPTDEEIDAEADSLDLDAEEPADWDDYPDDDIPF